MLKEYKKYRVKRHKISQPKDKSIKLIALTQGLNSIVDSVLYEYLNQWNWNAMEGNRTFYAQRNLRDAKTIEMQRDVMKYKNLYDPSLFVDHINGNGLDNRLSNLRMVDDFQNAWNSITPKNNTTGFKGVFRRDLTNRWYSRICIYRKVYNLGTFSSPEEASAVYQKASAELHGEFRRIEND